MSKAVSPEYWPGVLWMKVLMGSVLRIRYAPSAASVVLPSRMLASPASVCSRLAPDATWYVPTVVLPRVTVIVASAALGFVKTARRGVDEGTNCFMSDAWKSQPTASPASSRSAQLPVQSPVAPSHVLPWSGSHVSVRVPLPSPAQ